MCPVCNLDILVSNSSGSDPYSEHYKECTTNVMQMYSKQQRSNPALKKNQKVVCDICGKRLLVNSLPLHMETHSERNLLDCSYPGCETKCTNQHNLAKHEKRAHGEQNERFHCEHCGKNTFRTIKELKDHIRFGHEKQSEDIKCPDCDLVFVRRHLMVYHQNQVHFPDKYKCGICLKSFGNAYGLRHHALFHEEMKKFACDVCGKRLSTGASLDEHKRTHTGEKPFLCKYCPYRASSSSLLCHHKRQVHKAQYEEAKKEKQCNRIVSGNEIKST